LDVYLFSRPQGFLPGQIIGGGVFLVGLVTYTICSLWLVTRGRGAYVEFDPPTEFVATGPYRWCRNPVALSLMIAVLGEAIFFASPGILLYFILGIGLGHVQVVWLEEPLLRRRFGNDYENYCRTVPRWIPRSARAKVPA
jgi:protein-S-isoprenylcysteine O-methyltransferase Ste14